MKSRKKNNPESGIILFTVIMMIMVLSLIVISFMSSTVGQVRSSQSFVDRIKAEEFATGVFYQYHQRRLDNSTAGLPPPVSLDGKVYTAAATVTTVGGLNNTNSVTITISY